MSRFTPLVLALAVGCGEAGPAPLPPAPVAVVTLDGRPVAGLNLRLHASDGTAVGAGNTGPDGRTDLRGPGGQPVPPGKYKVVAVDLGDAEPNPMAESRGPAKSRLPAAYGKPASSPLSVTIEAGKPEYPVDLKSKP